MEKRAVTQSEESASSSRDAGSSPASPPLTECSIDFETRSVIDLTKVGVYQYAAHPSTTVMCMAWAFNEDDVELWEPSQPFPERIRAHAAAGGAFRAFNASFERIIWNVVLRRMLPITLPAMDATQWWCTMAEAAAMALPLQLEKAAKALDLSERKDTMGHAVMLRMSKPRKTKDGTLAWWEDARRLHTLYEYCKQDVRVEREMKSVIRRLIPHEREMWLLDQEINDRGFMVDLGLTMRLGQIASEGTHRANRTLVAVTDGAVEKFSQLGRLKTWLRQQGVDCDSLNADSIDTLLKGDSLTEFCRTALEARAEAGKSSVSKLQTIIRMADEDGVVRGTLQYCGAGTGRWAGRGVQPHNYPRPTVRKPEQYLPLILDQNYEMLDLLVPPMDAVVSLLRGTIIARPGRILAWADFSAIEARVLACLAGQRDLIDQFRHGVDVYTEIAKVIYRLPADAVIDTSTAEGYTMRQAGKVTILGAGFGMGDEKFQRTAEEQYGVVLTREEAHRIIYDIYRERNGRIRDYWYRIQEAVETAIDEPGSVHSLRPGLGTVKITKRGAYLYIILPSGRPLCYAKPKMQMRKTPWGEMRLSPTVRGVDGVTKQWVRYPLYGGLIVENIVQAVARDIMAESMTRVNEHGYPVLLTVHDEVITEPFLELRNEPEAFNGLMSLTPEWAKDWPITVDSKWDLRYRK